MTGHQNVVNDVKYSPDVKLIASASFDKSVRLWRAHDGQFIATFRGHVQAVYTLAWSADSRLIVSGSKDSTLKGKLSLLRFPSTSNPLPCSLERANQEVGARAAWTCRRGVWSGLGARWLPCGFRRQGQSDKAVSEICRFLYKINNHIYCLHLQVGSLRQHSLYIYIFDMTYNKLNTLIS